MHPNPRLPRREFLSSSARFAAGALIAPCGLSTALAATRDEDIVAGTLRASRFRGAPDGREREIWGYDDQLPGPVIRAKEGQMLRLKVTNDLAVPTSVHWHGMHQPGTWQMDGVDGVSGPPIAPGAAFIYEFRATPAGTHWYHSHVGVQYGEGLFGPLIIEERTPIARYDREVTLMLNDWFVESGGELLARLLKSDAGAMPDMKDKKMPGMKMKDQKDTGDIPFQSGLINGKGRAAGKDAALTVLEVTRGETIRLRLINASSTYALRFQIDGHSLTVIATDGQPMRPVTVDNLVLGNGERYDVLLNANQSGARWVRAATLDGNEIRALLRYRDASDATPEATAVQWGPRVLALADLRSPAPVELDAKPREIPIVLGGSMMPYRWSMNDQYFPKADPIKLAKGEVVRFVMRNPTGMDHPFHLHGHSFHVLGKSGALNLTDPALKDTIVVPSKEDVAIQWQASNPGRWFFHCHIEWHLATGMARVIEIG